MADKRGNESTPRDVATRILSHRQRRIQSDPTADFYTDHEALAQKFITLSNQSTSKRTSLPSPITHSVNAVTQGTRDPARPESLSHREGNSMPDPEMGNEEGLEVESALEDEEDESTDSVGTGVRLSYNSFSPDICVLLGKELGSKNCSAKAEWRLGGQSTRYPSGVERPSEIRRWPRYTLQYPSPLHSESCRQ